MQVLADRSAEGIALAVIGLLARKDEVRLDSLERGGQGLGGGDQVGAREGVVAEMN